ncbi:CHASE2 domain-containing protein [Cyanobacteria bacterium FACHB-471]|nr:CHASE2 domain-containing protein [Cyanobacteria bacterium FACHB-471]
MVKPNAEASIYTVGGTVQANEQGLYISRQADEELLSLCRQSAFAYVLTPRQMGKSSLMIRTAEQLIDEGRLAVIIDLTQIGTQVSAEEWYRGLLTLIADQLMLNVSVADWWQTYSHLGVTQRLTQFFGQVVLTQLQSPVVIFVDEIDTTLSLDFTDDFFAAIRYLYVARATQPEFQQLSFVLIGVATPGDLIRDPKRTPFNIGQRVDLTDFTMQEALPLAAGLGLPSAQAEQALEWVLKWTGGHPYLTQRLCQLMTQIGGSHWTEAEVDRLVVNTFSGQQSVQDSNLQFVRDMLTKRAPNLSEILTTYREIYTGKRTVFDEEQSLVKSHLKLSGIIRRRDDKLWVSNLIYKRIFNAKWIEEYLPTPLKILTAQRIFFTSLAVALLILAMRVLGVLQPLELQTFDHLMQLRPTEGLDNRITLVTLDSAYLDSHNSLSNQALNQLLEKLEPYEPTVIGLNLLRDASSLGANLQQSSRLVVACASGVFAPPVLLDISREQIGFSDVVLDPDNLIRRQLLFVAPLPRTSCEVNSSFSYVVATRYLANFGISITRLEDTTVQIGNSSFYRLNRRTGGYYTPSLYGDGGYNILLNYRKSPQIAREVSLSDILSDLITPDTLSELIRDRIIMIGRNDPMSADDFFITPHGVMSGTVLQAQMVSHILSAVLDKRPLIWGLPIWGDPLWIWAWATVGGLLAWRLRTRAKLVLCCGISLVVLYVSCFLLLLTWSAWIPLVPAALALTLTSGSIFASSITLQAQQKLKISKSLRDKLEAVCRVRGEDMTDVVARLIIEYIKQNKLP